MPNTAPSTQSLPLPARIFLTAMEQQLSLAEYAKRLDISADNLRAIVAAQLDQVEPVALNRLADVHQQSPDALHDQIRVIPGQESFAAWLKRNMEGISQQALRTRLHVDAKTLKQFLHAGLLPDSDQAERLARALYIDRTELARVVTANMAHQAGSERLIATANGIREQQMPASVVSTEPAAVQPGPARRQKPISGAGSTSAQEVAVTGVVAVDPAPVAEPLRNATPGRQGRVKTVEAVRGAVTVREDDQPRRSAAGGRAGTQIAPQLSGPTAGTPGDPLHESGAPGVEGPQPRAAHRRTKPTTAEPAAPASAEPTISSVSGAVGKRSRPQEAHRQAGAAHDPEVTRVAGVLAAQANPARIAAERPGLPASDATSQHTNRKQRRAQSASTRGMADASLPADIQVGAPTSTVETAPSAASLPVAAVAPAEHATEIKGAKSPAESNVPAPVPEDTRNARPPLASTDTPPDTAALGSILAADTTMLQLTPEEVRLIRHWRQLHPHGRRATLHYIGSLLVEE